MEQINSRWLIVALLLAGWLSGVHAQSATGRLHVFATIQASYHVEARGERHTSIGDGTAEGDDLRVSVYPGPVAIRVVKANSGSETYTLVLLGGNVNLTMRDLAYDTTVTAVIPDTQPDLPLALSVIPD